MNHIKLFESYFNPSISKKPLPNSSDEIVKLIVGETYKGKVIARDSFFSGNRKADKEMPYLTLRYEDKTEEDIFGWDILDVLKDITGQAWRIPDDWTNYSEPNGYDEY
jgi:hypothetical protein